MAAWVINRTRIVTDDGRVCRGHWQKWLHIAWTVIVVGLTAAILITAALSKPPPGHCDGIGWGCSLYGGDEALFEAIFLVPIALGLVVVGNAVIAVVGRTVRKRSHPSAPRAAP
jgi:hypothetical protein